MNRDQIYQEAFRGELEKLGFRFPRPSTIERVIDYGKKLKQRFEEKYESKKRKRRKRKRSSSFVFFGK